MLVNLHTLGADSLLPRQHLSACYDSHRKKKVAGLRQPLIQE